MTAASNLLILCSDQHSRAALDCYGDPVAKTPTLDRLAAQGVRFSRGYTPSPICISARASLATGLSVFEHCCWSSSEPYYGQVESYMHRLRAAGHAVVSIGKLHFRSGQDDNGFCDEILPMYLANEGRGWPQSLLRDPLPDYPGASGMADLCAPGGSDYTDYDSRVAAEACRWLQGPGARVTDKPWSLFVSFVSPHPPLTPPQRFYDLYEGCIFPEPYGRDREPDHPVVQQMRRFWAYDDYFDADKRTLGQRCYYGLCSFLDDNLRQVLAALEESGRSSDTTILYITDHGEMLGNHGFWGKSVMYEGAAGIPMILAGPGILPAVNETLVSLIDVAATVERAVGLSERPAKAPWQGRPLQDFVFAPERRRVVLSEYHDGGSPTGCFMLREGDWKYVYYAGGQPPQLFDLGRDPGELDDLGQDPKFSDQRAALQGRLSTMLDPEAINATAFRDQRRLIERYGGREELLAMESFDNTPLAG